MLSVEVGWDYGFNVLINKVKDINHQDIYGNSLLHQAILA